MHRISFEEGTAMARLALTKTGKEALDLFENVNRLYAECLAIKPNDYRALRYPHSFSLLLNIFTSEIGL